MKQDVKEELKIDTEDFHSQKERFKNERYENDTHDRQYLTWWAAALVTVYLIVVFFILMYNDRHFYLSDTVLSVLLGTTTVNVLGLMYIVLKGYFEKDKIGKK